jgi:hypothetical protein
MLIDMPIKKLGGAKVVGEGAGPVSVPLGDAILSDSRIFQIL